MYVNASVFLSFSTDQVLWMIQFPDLEEPTLSSIFFLLVNLRHVRAALTILFFITLSPFNISRYYSLTPIITEDSSSTSTPLTTFTPLN